MGRQGLEGRSYSSEPKSRNILYRLRIATAYVGAGAILVGCGAPVPRDITPYVNCDNGPKTATSQPFDFTPGGKKPVQIRYALFLSPNLGEVTASVGNTTVDSGKKDSVEKNLGDVAWKRRMVSNGEGEITIYGIVVYDHEKTIVTATADHGKTKVVVSSSCTSNLVHVA